jgi:hypothetical protein
MIKEALRSACKRSEDVSPANALFQQAVALKYAAAVEWRRLLGTISTASEGI